MQRGTLIITRLRPRRKSFRSRSRESRSLERRSLITMSTQDSRHETLDSLRCTLVSVRFSRRMIVRAKSSQALGLESNTRQSNI